MAKQTTTEAEEKAANVKAGMDAAAKEAEKAMKDLDKEAVKVVANWMKAHFIKAGYKRLSRLLVAKAD
jgi:hypothetical protein